MKEQVTKPENSGGQAPSAPPPRSRWRSGFERINAHYAGLRLYQWLWIVLCVVGGLVVVAPRILSRPVIYQTQAVVSFAMDRYGGLYGERENPDKIEFHTGYCHTPPTDFHIALCDAHHVVQQQLLAQHEVRFGLPTYTIAYGPEEGGRVVVRGIAPTPAEAQMLANLGAEELVRQVQAAGGREVLRNLLGWEMVVAMRNDPLVSPFEQHLRDIILRNAFPMSRPIEPVSARMTLDDLTPAEQNDLARALEARYNLLTFEINTRNAALDRACNTSYPITTAEREAMLQTCATHNDDVRKELDLRQRAIASREAINGALQHIRQTVGAPFTPQQPGRPVFYAPAPIPAAPVESHAPLVLALTALIGLAFGSISVAIDRTAGIMPKLRELWTYRELIGNLVMRDLRTRYKGSVLGYIWTQLAPLLMMLVFTFVFTVLMPSGIALFPVFLIVALLPWNFFSEALVGGTSSVINNASLIKKVFFPREILPLVSVLSSLLNYLLSLPMMFLVMAVTQLVVIGSLNFSWTFLYLPVIILLQTIFLLGITMLFSTLAVFFRDMVHLVGILNLFWFFLTPVFYSLDMMARPLLARIIRWLNPMASMIDFYRDILYGRAVAVGSVPTPGLPALDSTLRVAATTLLVLVVGYWFFRRHSGLFGEVI